MPAERYMYPGLVVTTHWVRPHYITKAYNMGVLLTYLLTFMYILCIAWETTVFNTSLFLLQFGKIDVKYEISTISLWFYGHTIHKKIIQIYFKVPIYLCHWINKE